MQIHDGHRSLRISVDTNEVFVNGERIKLSPKEMEVLNLLYANRNATLSRQELLDRVWGKDYQNDQGLTQAVSKLRLALKSDTGINIRTIPKKGYHLQLRREVIRRYKWAILIIIFLLGTTICLFTLIKSIEIRIEKAPLERPSTSSF